MAGSDESHEGPIERHAADRAFFFPASSMPRGSSDVALEPLVRRWSATSRSLSRFAPARRPHARRLRLECLEDRTLLSTIALTVTTLADDPSGPITGQTTLRDVITQADADPADSYVINFASGLQGTIDLTSPLPELSNNIDLQGPEAWI